MKVTKYIGLAALLLFAAACGKDDTALNENEPANETIIEDRTYAAIIEPTTRATVDTDGENKGKFTWEEGDRIYRIAGSNVSGTPILLQEGEYVFNAGEAHTCAIYPDIFASGSTAADGVPSKVTLPAAYTDYNGDIPTPMYADLTGLAPHNPTAIFNHLAGMLSIRLTNVPAGINNFVFTSAENIITGEFEVTSEEADKAGTDPEAKESVPHIKASTSGSGSRSVSFSFSDTSEGDELIFHLPLPVGTYKTFTLELKSGKDVVLSHKNTYSTAKKITRRLSAVLSVNFNKDEATGYHWAKLGRKYHFIAYDTDDLQAINSRITAEIDIYKTSNIALMNNITLPAPAEGESNWTPIEGEYTGTINGNGKSITGLVINGSGVGLIRPAEGCIINDLTLVDPNITGNEGNNGALVAGQNNGIIINCHVMGGSVTGYNAGGITPINSVSSRVIACTVTDTQITATGYYGGGIVGSNTSGSKLVASYAKNVNVTLTDETKFAGGIAGQNTKGQGNGLVYGCYSEGCTSGANAASFTGMKNLYGRHYSTSVTHSSYYKENSTYFCAAGSGPNIIVTSTTTDWAEAAAAMNTAIVSSGVACDYRWDTNEVKLVNITE